MMALPASIDHSGVRRGVGLRGLRLHLCQQLNGLRRLSALAASADGGIESDPVGNNAILEHRLKHRQRLRPGPAFFTRADHGAVGHDTRLRAALLHLPQQAHCRVPARPPAASAHRGVVGDLVGPDRPPKGLAEEREGDLPLLASVRGRDRGVVHEDVGLRRRSLQLVQQRQCLLPELCSTQRRDRDHYVPGVVQQRAPSQLVDDLPHLCRACPPTAQLAMQPLEERFPAGVGGGPAGLGRSGAS
mmetsp:Transcript_56882/g.184893  ORF Transcript_56882/g.184893 Transcript_56882/m.184893 type:complete len:245 (+) Transcript_56882:709-1443(+)